MYTGIIYRMFETRLVENKNVITKRTEVEENRKESENSKYFGFNEPVVFPPTI